MITLSIVTDYNNGYCSACDISASSLEALRVILSNIELFNFHTVRLTLNEDERIRASCLGTIEGIPTNCFLVDGNFVLVVLPRNDIGATMRVVDIIINALLKPNSVYSVDKGPNS